MKLHYQTLGAGQPLVILHGLFGAARNWQHIGQQLAAEYQVYLLDLRNHGHSPHAPQMDYAAMVGDLVDFIAQQKLSTFHLLGHSMGGKVAMLYALTQEPTLASLTVVDIAPVTYTHDFADVMAGLHAVEAAHVSSRKQADAALAAYVKPLGLRQFLLQNLVFEHAEYRWRIPISVIGQAIPQIVGFPDVDGAYHGATLFVKGADSDYIRTEHDALIRSYFPYAQTETIEHAGHWLHAEQPEAFLQAVRTVL